MPNRSEPGASLLLLNTAQLAEIFGVTEAAIRKRIRLRRLGPIIRRGRAYVMRGDALRKYLEEAEREWEQEGKRRA